MATLEAWIARLESADPDLGGVTFNDMANLIADISTELALRDWAARYSYNNTAYHATYVFRGGIYYDPEPPAGYAFFDYTHRTYMRSGVSPTVQTGGEYLSGCFDAEKIPSWVTNSEGGYFYNGDELDPLQSISHPSELGLTPWETFPNMLNPGLEPGRQRIPLDTWPRLGHQIYLKQFASTVYFFRSVGPTKTYVKRWLEVSRATIESIYSRYCPEGSNSNYTSLVHFLTVAYPDADPAWVDGYVLDHKIWLQLLHAILAMKVLRVVARHGGGDMSTSHDARNASPNNWRRSSTRYHYPTPQPATPIGPPYSIVDGPLEAEPPGYSTITSPYYRLHSFSQSTPGGAIWQYNMNVLATYPYLPAYARLDPRFIAPPVDCDILHANQIMSVTMQRSFSESATLILNQALHLTTDWDAEYTIPAGTEFTLTPAQVAWHYSCEVDPAVIKSNIYYSDTNRMDLKTVYRMLSPTFGGQSGSDLFVNNIYDFDIRIYGAPYYDIIVDMTKAWDAIRAADQLPPTLDWTNTDY